MQNLIIFFHCKGHRSETNHSSSVTNTCMYFIQFFVTSLFKTRMNVSTIIKIVVVLVVVCESERNARHMSQDS